MVWLRKSKVFERLIDQSLIMCEVSRAFQKSINDWRLENGCKELENLENRADEIVHAVTDEIERVFILPMDKEDIKLLVDSLDDIIDNLEQIMNRLYIYKVPEGNDPLKNFSNLISQAIELVHQGILLIRNREITSEKFAAITKELHDLENEGDRLHRRVLEEMMGGLSTFAGKDPILIIKWKEIFQTLEDTLDRCEDFAVIFSKLRIKYR